MNQRPRPTHDDSGSMHGTLIAIALLMIALLLAPKADAQPRPNRPNPEPAAQQTPDVPDWVVPGARITQFGAVAQHTKRNRTRDSRWREEDEEARQRDIDSGMPMDEVERRAREREEQRASDRRLYNSGTGGYSFTQYDIIAVTPVGVLIQSRLYLIPPLGGDPQLSGNITTSLVDHATGGGLWMRPADIEAAQPDRGENGGPTVFKANYAIGEHSFDAIFLVNKGGEYTRRQVYDCATGIQLYQSELTDTADIRSHAYSELSLYRVAQLPWHGSRYTQQIVNLTKLTYDSAIVHVAEQLPPDLQADVGRIPDVRMDVDMEITFQVTDPEVIGAIIELDIDMPTGPNQTTETRKLLSPNERLGLYIAPDILSQLESGQVLDEDPAIGYRIVVTDVYQVEGVTLVEISEIGKNNCYTSVCTYDASVGLLVAGVQEVPALGQRYESSIRSVE
ncbi:MAG: hypothetical protein ACIAXF_09360 [Phycisphaerales bacterium JB063]